MINLQKKITWQASYNSEQKYTPFTEVFPFMGLPPPAFLMLYKTVQEFTQCEGGDRIVTSSPSPVMRG